MKTDNTFVTAEFRNRFGSGGPNHIGVSSIRLRMEGVKISLATLTRQLTS